MCPVFLLLFTCLLYLSVIHNVKMLNVKSFFFVLLFWSIYDIEMRLCLRQIAYISCSETERKNMRSGKALPGCFFLSLLVKTLLIQVAQNELIITLE